MSETKNKVAKKPKPTDIISHSPFLIENFQFSSLEFYTRVEKALQDRQMPGLEIERVDWPEGGILSPMREYLRAKRERLVFDICGAPFGTGFFVSLWFGEKDLELSRAAFIMAIVFVITLIDAFFGIFGLSFAIYRIMWIFHIGWFLTTFLCIIGFPAAFVYLVRAGHLKHQDLDALFFRIPGVAFIYARFFRRVTYYRIDNMVMYQQAVRNAVMQVVDEITSSKGIKPMSDSESKPILKELWLR